MADINLDRRAIINYTAVRGDTFVPPPVSFIIDNTPEDFSGAAIKMHIRIGDKLMQELTIGSGIAVSSNSLQYTVSAIDIQKWQRGVYRYDVQKTKDGVVSTIQAGTITLIDEVTQ